MPEVNPQLRRGLIALSALLLFVGVIGIAVVGDAEDKGDIFAGPAADTSTTTDNGGFGAGGAGGDSSGVTFATPSTASAPATTAKPRTTGTTGAPPATTPATTDPGPAKAPALGTYKYSMTITDDEGTRTSEHDAKVEAGQDSPGVTRRVTTRKDESSTLKTTEAWAANGVNQERIHISTSSGGQNAEFDCDWQPDVLVYAQPLSVGAKWTVDSSCETTAGGQPVKLREQGERRVTGRATTTVGGTQVNVWIIETSGKLTVTSGASVLRTDEVEAVSHFEPTRGVEVYDKTTTKSAASAAQATPPLSVACSASRPPKAACRRAAIRAASSTATRRRRRRWFLRSARACRRSSRPCPAARPSRARRRCLRPRRTAGGR